MKILEQLPAKTTSMKLGIRTVSQTEIEDMLVTFFLFPCCPVSPTQPLNIAKGFTLPSVCCVHSLPHLDFQRVMGLLDKDVLNSRIALQVATLLNPPQH